MVQRKCPKCNALFYKKSNYIRHINKVYDCSIKNLDQYNLNDVKEEDVKYDDICENIPNHSITIPSHSKNIPNYSITISNENNEELVNKANELTEPNFDILDIKNQDLCCGFCSKKYSTKTNLNKHLKICKIKKETDNEKEKIFKLLLEKDKENKENKERIEKLEKQNLLLMNKIDKLISIKDNSKHSKTTKKTTNNTNSNNTNSNNTINNNQTNNTQNNNILMVNFGKEDLSVIDERQFIDKIVKRNNISGVKIPDEVLKIIHFNPQYPQLSNIYISDINREKCMVYEDGEWKLSNVNNIPQIMDKVCVFSAEQISNLRTKHPDNKPLHDRLNTIEKYNNMIDGDFVDDLRDDGRQIEIARCEEFQAHAYNTLKKTLYNEGKKLKKMLKLNNV